MWLSNPLQSAKVGPDVTFERYTVDAVTADVVANGVTKEIKIGHVSFPWGANIQVELGVGRGYSYPGFEVFEEER
jgi:hypothetical protein